MGDHFCDIEPNCRTNEKPLRSQLTCDEIAFDATLSVISVTLRFAQNDKDLFRMTGTYFVTTLMTAQSFNTNTNP